MKFCNQCGNEKSEQHRICTNCGAEDPQVKKDGKSRSEKVRPSASKKQKIIVGSILAAGIALFGVKQLADAQFAPVNTLEGFMEAVAEEDVEAIRSYMITSEGDAVSESQIDWLITQMEGMNNGKGRVEDHFISQIDDLNDGTVSADEESTAGLLSLSFEHTGSRWVFFDDYHIVLHPQEMSISLDHDDQQVRINGEEVEAQRKSGSRYSLGEYYPDIYEVSIYLDTVFGTHEFTDMVEHTGEGTVQLSHSAIRVEFISPIEDADLFYEEEDTGISLSSGSNLVEPVILDDTLHLYAKADTPFGMLQSQTEALDDQRIEFIFTADHTMGEAITDTLYNAMDEGRFIEEVDTRGQPHIIKEIAVQEDRMFLTENDNGRDWVVRVPYKEIWAEGEPEDRMNESNKVYEAVLTYHKASSEWEILGKSHKSEDPDFEWTYFKYDKDEQLAYFMEERQLTGKDKYLDDAYTYTEELINEFHRDHVSAINGGSKDRVNRHIHSSAGQYEKTVLDYIDHLRRRNITQDFEGSEVTSFTEAGENSYIIVTEDLYQIHNHETDSSRRAFFETEYELMLTDDGFYLTNLLSTDELWSEDQ